MPRCQSRASCTGVREACEQGHWVSLSSPPRVLGSPQHRPCLAGTHHILHAQLGSIEQQELRCFVVPVAHSLVECCVPFLWKSRQSLL